MAWFDFRISGVHRLLPTRDDQRRAGAGMEGKKGKTPFKIIFKGQKWFLPARDDQRIAGAGVGGTKAKTSF